MNQRDHGLVYWWRGESCDMHGAATLGCVLALGRAGWDSSFRLVHLAGWRNGCLLHQAVTIPEG